MSKTSSSHNVNSITKMMLWLNSGCNAQCQTCDIWREKIGKALTPEQIQAWAPEWKQLGLKTIVICGESLLYSDVWEVIRIIRSFDIKLELLTNGLLLEREARNVVEFFDVLRVSLDGPKDIHNKMRGRKNIYDALKRGIAAVRAIRPDMRIDGKCAVNLKNFPYLRQTVQAAKDLRLDSISFSGADVYNEEAFRRFERITQSYINEFVIQGDDLDALREEIKVLNEENSEDFETGFISDSREKLNYLLIEYYEDITLGKKRKLKCNSPWTSVVLEYDGTVRPCFPMPAYGNMKDYSGLRELVNSEGAKAFREGLIVEDNQVCRRCVDQTVNKITVINANSV